MPKKKKKGYWVPGFTRRRGERVAGHTRRRPVLTARERGRRAGVARRRLLPAGVKAAGKRGFYGTVEKLRPYQDKITSPERLSGWLKKEAAARGELSPRHPYVGRRGYRKYPAAAKRMAKREYRTFLRKKRYV